MSNTHKQSNIFFTIVWLVLIALTVVSYEIGETGQAGTVAMLVLLGIALVKGQLVANYFMGLRHVALLWRAIAFFYFLIVGGFIALAFVIGQ